MAIHISDHAIFRNAWSAAEWRPLFEDRAQVAGWIDVMATLADIQAEVGLIPASAGARLVPFLRGISVDDALLTEARDDFERSNHSLLGLIRALERRSPDGSGEWLCYGATVQDITDTQLALTLSRVQALCRDRLDAVAERLAGLARCHRDTAMCGRTHGQPGLPITFGFKLAGWLDEILRHRRRLAEIGERLRVGQLAGGVGSLSSFGPAALMLQERFFDRLGLRSPAISWTASRDRLAEWLHLLALVTATADRIGHEVYNLQRPEIGELAEGLSAATVGSITMPQKRNPEISEHLGTLARAVRYDAAWMLENLVHDHERDGRSWKGEWAILPGACLAAGKALDLLGDLLQHLEVREDRMRQNLAATRGFIYAERVMLALARVLGKQSAHTLVHRVAMAANRNGTDFLASVLATPEIRLHLDARELERLCDPSDSTGRCGEMVDRVLAQWESKAA